METSGLHLSPWRLSDKCWSRRERSSFRMVCRRRTARADAHSLYQDLRATSLRSATRLQGRELLTDADLYDEDGLPA